MRLISIIILLGFLLTSCQQEKTALINGNLLPNLSLTDVNSQRIDLSTIKNKIILVEFWASWCKPCRDKHPELNRIYNVYKDQKFENADGFEIYYVNLDKKKGDWVKAMEKDSIDHWTYQVADLMGMQKSEIPALFDFEKIPTAYVIDANGRIIGKDLTEDRLFHLLKRRLLTD